MFGVFGVFAVDVSLSRAFPPPGVMEEFAADLEGVALRVEREVEVIARVLMGLAFARDAFGVCGAGGRGP